MRRKIKHLTALLCALVLALSLCPAALAAGVTPRTSYPANRQDYQGNWTDVIRTYLYQNSKGGLTRVEYDGTAVLAEEYNSFFQLLSKKTMPMELPLWGGFFAGSQYNFLVFGQNNLKESPAVEFIRVVKYSKDWQRLGSASFYDEDIYEPIHFGTLRCAESGGRLYIITCHTGYDYGDGKHHQSSMVYQIDQSSMIYERLDPFFVSHSFDHYILIDQQNRIVTVDLGDSSPYRAVNLQTLLADFDPLQKYNPGTYEQEKIFDIPGQKGANYTGVRLGGLEETTNNYVTAFSRGSRTVQRGFEGSWDVYLSFTNKNTFQSNLVKVNTTPNGTPPILASTGLGGGYVIWNDYAKDRSQSDTLHYRTYSDNGTLGPLMTAKGRTSDCKPVLFNGKFVWLTAGEKNAPTFYLLDASGVKAVPATAAPGAVELPPVTKAGIPAPNAPKSSKGTVTPGGSEASGGSASGSSGAEDIYCQGCGYLIRKAGSGKLPDFNNGGAANAFIYRCSKCYNYYFCHQCSKDPATEALYLQHVKTCQG